MRILSWKETGMSTEEIAKWLGQHRTSIDHLWVKLKGLPKFVIKHKICVLSDPKDDYGAKENPAEAGFEISQDNSCQPTEQCA